ncbi:MAG TPA: DUF2804 domain-containing protein [Acholeplasmataceae bacterium]|nr:DUF2804 domain-containing protein [Acholeplasmataceae bacterium]
MAQHKLTKGPLLDAKGNIIEAGYSTSLVKDYDRDMVKVRGMRIKEWDYYYIGNDQYGIALTVADNSYMWLTSCTFFDFSKPEEISSTKMGWFPNGKLNLPRTSQKGDVIFKRKKQSFEYRINGNKRNIIVSISDFTQGLDLKAELQLEPTIKDSMVIVTPFEKKKHFYYNQKINLLQAKGNVKIGDKIYDFNGSYGVLDWGRGVWTYKNTWYWSSLSGVYQNKKIGFNLGYGFGDTSKATENMLFYDDETIKYDDVIFNIPNKDRHDDFMSPWTITDEQKHINLTFTPILDRYSHSNVVIIKSIQHQVFGKFSGTFTLPSGNVIEIKDMMGFAEKVVNHW